MASVMLIPAPPRTPTPPLDEPSFLGLDPRTPRAFQAPDVADDAMFSPQRLSPIKNDAFRDTGFLSPGYTYSEHEHSPVNPFNFQPTAYNVGRPPSPVKSNVGQRRGHKYKHSSVSHQIFLEPTPKAPLQLPASVPIPTLKEGWSSMSREQTMRASWCLCHMFAAAYVEWTSQGSMAMTALSHLIFYDAIGALLCAVVDVLSNFEVWKSSSISHPFGLRRAEVLVGFAMSILLLFMGFDLITHDLHHALEGLGGHEAHHEHSHERVSPGSVNVAVVLAIASTLISAIMLKNHQRIARAIRLSALDSLPTVLNNPSHLLTLSCSLLLLLMPLLTKEMYGWVDRALSGGIAFAMLMLGSRLVWNLGSMLLMSYSGSGVTEIRRDIETDSAVVAIEEARFWQVHYGLCLANLKLRVRGTDDSLARLRERITSLIRQRLGGAYGAGGQKWDVSIQLTVEIE